MLVVLFARAEDTHTEAFQDETEKINRGTNKHLNIINAVKDKFIEQIKQADAIVIRGGDSLKLLNLLKRHPQFKEAIKSKTVAGSSAGAYVLSKYYYSADYNKIFEGLGILPIRLICHYDSKEFDVKQSAREQLDKYPKSLDLVILKDHEWKVFNA